MTYSRTLVALNCLGLILCLSPTAPSDDAVVRVFIFAGQSNMVGSDSKVDEIKRFPPFVGTEAPLPSVRFNYCLGRENKTRSNGWVPLQPVNDTVGPELSFARTVQKQVDAPIAIIKCAAGGTHLGGDWNPNDPSGFKMYPLALKLVKESLAQLDSEGTQYRLEGFMWHQGENDMFNADYMANYGKNLRNFIDCWRRDLNTPNLKFYIGELCTKTIWGMDLRPRMYAISVGQKQVTNRDEHAEYVETSHVGVKVGNPVGLHYHYGTLGQLEHGENYARAYLRAIEQAEPTPPAMGEWPYKKQKSVDLYILAGHRNMEGERAFTAQVPANQQNLLKPRSDIAYLYNLAAGYRKSDDWQALQPTGLYQTFGPELSFAHELKQQQPNKQFAIAKFTDSGSQMIDWSQAGSKAVSRHVYPRFLRFVNGAKRSIESKGNTVRLAGIIYHVGENDMSYLPFRQQAPKHLFSMIKGLREDLEEPDLQFFISQQPPISREQLDRFDPVSAIAELCDGDKHAHHLTTLALPNQDQEIVLNTAGVISLGSAMANAVTACETK